MAITRSPNHPSLTLEEAIDRAKRLFEREKHTEVTPEVAVRAWGYKTVSGPAGRALSALKQYGLLSQGDKALRVTSLAQHIIYGGDSGEQYFKALRAAALFPPILDELHSEMHDASDDALLHHLIVDMKFSEGSAKKMINIFRANLELLNKEEKKLGPELTGGVLEKQARDSEKANQVARELVTSGEKLTFFSWPLSRDVVAEVRFLGENIKSSHFDLLSKYLELARQAYVASED